MEFKQHTINWTKGEILEATIMGIVGLFIIIAAVLFWKFGHTLNARTLIIPLMIAGMILVVMSASGIYSNRKRIADFEKRWQNDPVEFVKTEKERVEGFDNIFKYSYPAMIIIVVGGAILFFLFKSPTIKAISLAQMLIGLAGYFIDHFAAERADLYYQEILREVESH